jgi:acyl-coenzyme A synthetase/AMP-(fatty) acid ligase
VVTGEFVAFHAAERPDAIAFVLSGRDITYAAFDRDLSRFSSALAALGVSPGNLVAISTDNPYLHCLLILALEELRAVSASFSLHERDSCRPLLSRADLILSDSHDVVTVTQRHLLISEAWLREVWALPGTGRPAAPPITADAAVRILRTSGTTGVMKMMLLRRRQQEGRLQRYAAEYQFTEASRYLLTMPLTVGHIYGSVMACLRSGGRLVFESRQRMPPAAALATHGITDVTLMPLHLKQVLDGLPPDFSKPDRLTVCTFGAPISAALRERALARLATVVYGDYGCNEVGLVFLTRSGDDSDGGTIWPGVRVEVVDENNLPVPKGEVGRIRVRTEFMVDGYLDDSEATQRMFRDGWFYPGDSGALKGSRRLQVLGRSDELLNIGGVKHSPAYLENLITRNVAVRDVGICSLRNSDGFEEICVAVVADGISDRDLSAHILNALRTIELGRVHICKTDALPRNEAGKIQRDELCRLVASAARATR